jgi:beta-xylosidase
MKVENEMFELIKRYYLSKQIEDILSVNPNVSGVIKSLVRVTEIVNNVTNMDELYDMLENFGYDELCDLDIIQKWDNSIN